jgi:hypothetical protein
MKSSEIGIVTRIYVQISHASVHRFVGVYMYIYGIDTYCYVHLRN